MILTNRLFTRNAPTRDALSIYIFCEGAKREVKYFEYFKELDSRINIEIYRLKHHEDNSPLGLYNIAVKCLVKSDDNPNPKYELIDNDEIWIVLDTDRDISDSRASQITELRKNCKSNSWSVAQSNPCFEVWLYYHFFNTVPSLEEIEKCSSWKQYLNKETKSGFDSRRHPILIGDAISNSKKNHSGNNDIPAIGTTDVHRLAENIYSLVKLQIDEIRKTLNLSANM